MSNDNSGGPAFPSLHVFTDREGEVNSQSVEGMSLRDYAAIKAMQALLHPGVSADWIWETYDTNSVSEAAYRQADAVLAARGTPQ